MPMVSQDAPAPRNRVVFAVGGRIIGETHRPWILRPKLHHPLHDWGTATLIFRTIIHLKTQRRHVRKPRADGLLPLRESVRQAVTGHFGGPPIPQQCIKRRAEEAAGGARCRWLNIVLSCCDYGTPFAPRAQGPTFTGALASMERCKTSSAPSAA